LLHPVHPGHRHPAGEAGGPAREGEPVTAGGQAPAGRASTGQAPAGQAPAGQAPAGQAPGVALPPAGPGLPAGRGARLELAALRGSRRFGGPVAAVAVGIVLVLVLQGNGFTSTLVLDMLVYAVAAMSLDFLGGYAGLISLGMAGFLGVGAYG